MPLIKAIATCTTATTMLPSAEGLNIHSIKWSISQPSGLGVCSTHGQGSHVGRRYSYRHVTSSGKDEYDMSTATNTASSQKPINATPITYMVSPETTFRELISILRTRPETKKAFQEKQEATKIV